ARRAHLPVAVPRLAAVEGEELLPRRIVGAEHLPLVTNAQRDTLDHVVAFEPADAVLEAAAHRVLEWTGVEGRGPPDPPHVGRRVVEPHGETLESRPARKVGRPEGVDVAETTQDRPRLADCLELDPLVVAEHERPHALAVLDPPPAGQKVEVVAA